MKKARGCLAVGVVAGVLVIVGGFLLAYLVTEHGRERASAQLRKPESLETLERLARLRWERVEPLSEEDIAHLERFHAYERLFARYESSEARRFDIAATKENPDKWWSSSEDVCTWDEVTWECVQEYTALCEEYIPEVRRVAALGGPVAGFDAAQAAAMELHHTHSMRDLANMLRLHAIATARQSEMDEAVDDIIAGMRLADALACEPVLRSQSTRNYMYAILIDAIQQAFAPGDLPREQVMRLVEHLAGADHLEAFAEALAGQAIVDLTLFEQIRNETPWAVDQLEYCSRYRKWEPSPAKKLLATLPARPVLNLNEAAYAEMMQRTVAAAQLPLADAVEEYGQIRREVLELSVLQPVSFHLLAWVCGVCHIQANHESMARLVQIGLVVELYHAEHGEYPASLDAIAPDFGGSVPNDPLTNEPYHYERMDDSFLLRSKGQYERYYGTIAWRTSE